MAKKNQEANKASGEEPKKRGRPFLKKNEPSSNPENTDNVSEQVVAENNPPLEDVAPAADAVDITPPIVDEVSDDGMPDNPPIKDYSPLEGQPIDMPHAKPNVNINPKDIPLEIKEPIFTPPPFIEDVPPTPPPASGGGGAGGSGGSTPPPSSGGASGTGSAPASKPFTNPDLITSTDKEKEDGAKFLVESTLDAYDLAHRAGRWYLEVSEEDVAKYVTEGKIQLTDVITHSEEGEEITVGEFIASYNKSVNETIQVSGDFRKKITPVLVRIFIKRGWGFTDEQYALYLITKDLSTKVGMGYMFKKQMSSILQTIVKVNEKQVETETKIKSVEEENEALRQRVANFEAMQSQAVANANASASASEAAAHDEATKSTKITKSQANKGKGKKSDVEVDFAQDAEFVEPEEK